MARFVPFWPELCLVMPLLLGGFWWIVAGDRADIRNAAQFLNVLIKGQDKPLVFLLFPPKISHLCPIWSDYVRLGRGNFLVVSCGFLWIYQSK